MSTTNLSIFLSNNKLKALRYFKIDKGLHHCKPLLFPEERVSK